MGRIVGRPDAANENPSIPAPFDGIEGGTRVRPHADLPFEQRHPELADYQPDLTGKIEGENVDSVDDRG